MNTKKYRFKNNLKRFMIRLKHPWPLYKKIGGMSAIITRADGTTEDLGQISDTYIRRR
jgi:hypothetical protein